MRFRAVSRKCCDRPEKDSCFLKIAGGAALIWHRQDTAVENQNIQEKNQNADSDKSQFHGIIVLSESMVSCVRPERKEHIYRV